MNSMKELTNNLRYIVKPLGNIAKLRAQKSPVQFCMTLTKTSSVLQCLRKKTNEIKKIFLREEEKRTQ